MKRLTILIVSLLWLESALSAETCSRVATINYQEVLVDASSSNKGEGLRYYLEKDQTAKDLLNEYQDNNKPSIRSAAMSTLGGVMMVGSFFNTGNTGSGITNRDFLLFGGITLIGLNYLISKTNQYHNEYLLSKSVEEYNKRNTPRIFFSPTDPKAGMGLGLGVGQEF